MERKRVICRIFVLTLLAVAALSLCAFADADPPYYFDYKIKGNDVYLRSAPATANQYNVIGILQTCKYKSTPKMKISVTTAKTAWQSRPARKFSPA